MFSHIHNVTHSHTPTHVAWVKAIIHTCLIHINICAALFYTYKYHSGVGWFDSFVSSVFSFFISCRYCLTCSTMHELNYRRQNRNIHTYSMSMSLRMCMRLMNTCTRVCECVQERERDREIDVVYRVNKGRLECVTELQTTPLSTLTIWNNLLFFFLFLFYRWPVFNFPCVFWLCGRFFHKLPITKCIYAS